MHKRSNRNGSHPNNDRAHLNQPLDSLSPVPSILQTVEPQEIHKIHRSHVHENVLQMQQNGKQKRGDQKSFLSHRSDAKQENAKQEAIILEVNVVDKQ